MLKFGIITVSTTCAKEPSKDVAGPALENEIKRVFPASQVAFKKIVTDDRERIESLLRNAVDVSVCDVLFTVGGTGFSPSDVTPEATKAVIEKEASGLSYALISKSLAKTDMAMLSRLVCGIKGSTIIINFPGSTKAALECFGFVSNCLPHAVALLRGEELKVRKTHQEIQQSGDSAEESKVKIKAGASRIRKSQYPLLEVEDAKKVILEVVSKIEETESVPIENARTRVLAEDIRAIKPVPDFPASMKDGYAVKASDGVGHRKVRSVAAAGDAPDFKNLESGEVIRISTGAAVPAGADAVVQVEDTELVEVSEDGEIEKVINIFEAPKVGQDIRQIGSDIQQDTVVLQKHNEITPAYIGVLAMLGLPKVKVIRRPKIGIISTGNELVHPRETLQPGHIYDSNKVTLMTLLRSYGYDTNDCGIARDTPNSVFLTIKNALKNNDILISSGGVSMSEYDLIKQVLVEDFDAKIHFGRINMKPGKPTVFATVNFEDKQKIVFALPGNPVSCCVTSLLFVIPTLKYMENNTKSKEWPMLNVTLIQNLVNRDIRPEYVRLIVTRDNKNEFIAHSTGNQVSSRLNSMVDANALLVVPGKSEIEKGASVAVHFFGTMY